MVIHNHNFIIDLLNHEMCAKRADGGPDVWRFVVSRDDYGELHLEAASTISAIVLGRSYAYVQLG